MELVEKSMGIESVTENYRPIGFRIGDVGFRNVPKSDIPYPKSNGVRVKMCGKSAQRSDANRDTDKPCGLKCHVHREGATSVASLCCSYSAGGRQIHFVGDGESR